MIIFTIHSDADKNIYAFQESRVSEKGFSFKQLLTIMEGFS